MSPDLNTDLPLLDEIMEREKMAKQNVDRRGTKAKKKTKAKWETLELQCVGMRHHVSKSTRKFMASRIDPIQVEFKREPDNPNDSNAIAVWTTDDPDNPYRNMHIGYVPRLVAQTLAPVLDKRKAQLADGWVSSIDVDDGIADLQVKLRLKTGA